MDHLKHTIGKIAPAPTVNGSGTNNGHGMDYGKSGNSDQMNASYMIKKDFIQQVPSAGTPAGKSGTGKEMSKMATTQVSAHGMDAGK